MSKVEEIAEQIRNLSRAELAQFREWYVEFDAHAWDSEIEADANAGKLDALIDEALLETSQRRYLELAKGKVQGGPGPLVFGRLRAAHQNLLPLTSEQRAELNRCLDAYEADGNPGRPAEDVIAEIKKRL